MMHNCQIRALLSVEGTLRLARNSQDADDLIVGCRSLRRFLESMRDMAAGQRR
jgi:hypothetical protein